MLTDHQGDRLQSSATMSTLEADAALPHNLIGTQAFLPALLAHIRNLSTTQSLPLDPVIFQSILLCLIAGEKHLILRTSEEDIGLTVKIVVWTLSCVFDIPTRKLRIRPSSAAAGPPSSPSASTSSRLSKFKSAASDPTTFLRALFLHGASSSNSNETSQDEYDGESAKHHHQRQPSHLGKRAKNRTHHAHAPEYMRSHSVPNNLVNIVHNTHGPAAAPAIPRTTSPESLLMGSSIAQQQQHLQREYGTASAAPSSIVRPKPIYPTLSTSGPHLPHAYTDPLPRPRSTHSRAYMHRRTPSAVSSTAGASQTSKGEGGLRQFPSAAVLSGLEDASEGVQRAFGRVLSERKVVLGGRSEDAGGEEEVRALPEGFLVVYVCPWSATERPAVHKTLLDKFAMSTNVTIPPNIRREFHLLPFSPVPKPFTAPPQYNHPQQQQSTSSAFPSPKKMFFSHSNPGTPSPGQASALPPQSSYTPPPMPPIALPGTASMHRRASSHSSHSFRSHAYTHHAQRHSHYSGSHSYYSHSTLLPPAPAILFPYPPLPSSFLKTLHTIAAQHTRIAPALTLYMADIFSATRHHPRLEGLLLGRAALKDAEALVRAGRVVGADLTGMELLRPGVGVGDASANGLEEDQDTHGHENEDGDEDEDDEDYSSALDISIHDEPLISVHAPSVASSVAPIVTARGIDILDVSEVNIARIVPRVISHRVRVRSEPDEEVLASALFGATFQPPVPQPEAGKAEEDEGGAGLTSEERQEGEVSVKAVLVQILAEV